MAENQMYSVFGASGFIGSSFIKMFNERCIPIERNSSSSKSNDVLYLISTTHNYHVFDEPYKDIETNLTKLVETLEEFRKQNKTGVFNFVSSWFVYGKKTNFPVKETEECNPEGFYSITKYAAEKLLISYCNTFNIKYRIFRLTNIIGENATKVSIKRNAIQYLIETMANDEEIKLYNGGSDVRDFMHIEDACRAIMICMEKAPVGEVINISNSEPHSIGEIVYYARNKLGGIGKVINILPPDFHRVVQSKDMHLDNEKLISYGYLPSITVYKAIDRIVETIKVRLKVV